MCGISFERKPRARKDTSYCSKKCRNKGYYQKTGAQFHKPRVFLTPEQREQRKHVWWQTAYQNRRANPIKWAEYIAQKRARNPFRREYFRNRWRQANFYGVELPTPYVGHMWMDKIRELAGPMPDQSAPWADKYNDIVGEGLLAFLEGRDPVPAMDAARKRENFWEYNVKYLSDIEDHEESYNWWMARMPRPEIYTGDTYDSEDISEAPRPSESATERVTDIPKARFRWSRYGWHMKAGSRKGGRGPKRSHMTFRPRDNKKDHRGMIRRMKYDSG